MKLPSKSINFNHTLIESKPFTKAEIYFRIDTQVEVHDCYSVLETVTRWNKCVSRLRKSVGDVQFSAELKCRALRYGSDWKHIHQIVINQRIA